MEHTLYFDTRRILGKRDPMLYGHFLEHFHRQIYGGIYQPSSPLSDGDGLRRDVADAMAAIRPAIVRWPGGCYVSGYHWEDGVGPDRRPHFDKAWRVVEPNDFGTDEFIRFCRRIDAEPYICTNAGTGTCEEMSNWVEYCNLEGGRYGAMRVANGFPAPYNVKYWSIGNENYFDTEVGCKSMEEWGRYVACAALMMKRVDPNIQLSAAATTDLTWNKRLLEEAGHRLDWMSIHIYADQLWQENKLSPYERCMAYTTELEEPIRKAEAVLMATGLSRSIRIAVDEWNLRGWHHPGVDRKDFDYLTPRDLNDDNATYTMADALYTAAMFHTCLRHCNSVGMLNFAPSVNTRGMIYADDTGIVLRSTYHVFALYATLLGDTVLDSWMASTDSFSVDGPDGVCHVPCLDAVATLRDGKPCIAVLNRHPDEARLLSLAAYDLLGGQWTLHTLNGDSKDAYNSTEHPDAVSVTVTVLTGSTVELPPHSVNILVMN